MDDQIPSGTALIRTSAAVLEILDELGIPHHEGPRHMLKTEVVDIAPLPQANYTPFVAQLEQAYAQVEQDFLREWLDQQPKERGDE